MRRISMLINLVSIDKFVISNVLNIVYTFLLILLVDFRWEQLQMI
jgi:hypothetical protein